MYNTLEDGTRFDTQELAEASAALRAAQTGQPQYIWRDATGGADYLTVQPPKKENTQ